MQIITLHIKNYFFYFFFLLLACMYVFVFVYVCVYPTSFIVRVVIVR